MICIDCRVAAEHLRAGDAPERVAHLHSFCRGGNWCDCQHATGEHINRREVEREDRSLRPRLNAG